MDTKLKKNRKTHPVIAFLCFFFAVNIFIGLIGIGFLGLGSIYSYGMNGFTDAYEDYQDTRAFQNEIEHKLMEILTIDHYAYDSENFDKEEFLRSILLNGMEESQSFLYKIEYKNNVISENDTEKKLSAFTNMEKVQKLPAGYSFLLYFDGEKVYIQKDNQLLDIYGDEKLYRSDGWYVPGYLNVGEFSEDQENYRIWMLVLDEPLEYDAPQWITYIIHFQQSMRVLIAVLTVVVMIMLILFMIYIFLRKDKAIFDQKLARFTGWFWFEIKLVATLITIFIGWNCFVYTFIFRNVYFWDLVLVFACIWALYLVLVDIRYNKKFYTHNSVMWIIHKVSLTNKKYPVQRRLLRRTWQMIAIEAGIALLGLFLLSFVRSALIFLVIFLLMISGMVGVLCLFRKKYVQTVNDIGLLLNRIELIRSGTLNAEPLVLSSDADLNFAANNLNSISEGIQQAVERQLKSERMKIELITNVSHDIKTPLTSIISYVDLLKQEENLPEYVMDYIRILDRKATRLKIMVQDVFDISKASTGNIELHMENLDLVKLVKQTIAEMEEPISQAPLIVKTHFPDQPAVIYADGQRLYRVFQNLIQNALQYSLEGSRIYITVKNEQGWTVAEVKNISKIEIPDHVDLSERFVRGDWSRSDGGSGLGLSIARSFTEACGGRFSIRTEADLFTVQVSFFTQDPGQLQPQPAYADNYAQQAGVSEIQQVPADLSVNSSEIAPFETENFSNSSIESNETGRDEREDFTS